MTVRFAALLFFTLAALADAPKTLKPRLPSLASVFPQGSQPGRTVRTTVFGEYLDRTQTLVFLDQSVKGRVLKSSYTHLELEFEIAADAAYGPHYFRVISPRGASNLLLFRVSDQPQVMESEPNSQFEEAQQVAVPATINGRLDVDGDFDFFRFHAGKGETWTFDVRSARNGNGLDPALILLDSERRELAHSEDVFIWDPFLTYTFRESGEYVAVVQPTHAHVDPNFAYQLDIRRTPHLQTVSPLSVRPGTVVEATLFGAALEGGAKLWFDAPDFRGEVIEMRGSSARIRLECLAGALDGRHELALVTPFGRSDTATFLVDRTPAHPGGEEIRPPVSITSVARYRRPERFRFEAKAGETIVFEVRGQRFGSPVDSLLRLLDDTGKEIAANDDAKIAGDQFNKDSYLLHTFSKAGRYQVEIRNLWKTTGENFPYQLLVRPPRPGFELMLASDRPYDSLRLKSERKEGYEGPIPFEITGLPQPLSGEIPAGKNEITVPLPSGVTGQFQVMAGGAPAWRSVKISSGGGEGATQARVELATLAPAETPLFALEAEASSVNLVRGGTAEIRIRIDRAPSFREPIQFSYENLPPGVTADAATASPESGNATIRLRAQKDAKPGRYARVAVLGRAGGGQIQEAPKIAVVLD